MDEIFNVEVIEKVLDSLDDSEKAILQTKITEAKNLIKQIRDETKLIKNDALAIRFYHQKELNEVRSKKYAENFEIPSLDRI